MQFKTSIAIAAFYAHPFEVVLSNIGAHLVWPFLLGMHPAAVAVLSAIGTMLSMSDHSGYWLSPTPHVLQPFFHDAHHEHSNCDFGIIGLCDWIFGTSQKWQAKRAQVTSRGRTTTGK